MSTVTKCDRCGTIFNPLAQTFEETPQDPGDNASWRLNITKELWPHSGELNFDLCPNCKASLNDWLQMADEPGPADGRR